MVQGDTVKLGGEKFTVKADPDLDGVIIEDGPKYGAHTLLEGDTLKGEHVQSGDRSDPDWTVDEPKEAEETPEQKAQRLETERAIDAAKRIGNRPDSDFGKGGFGKEGGFINGDILNDVVDAGRSLLRKGVDFARWAGDMVDRLGDRIRPYLQRAWDAINGGQFLSGKNELTAEDWRTYPQAPHGQAFTVVYAITRHNARSWDIRVSEGQVTTPLRGEDAVRVQGEE